MKRLTFFMSARERDSEGKRERERFGGGAIFRKIYHKLNKMEN